MLTEASASAAQVASTECLNRIVFIFIGFWVWWFFILLGWWFCDLGDC
jgi:hypothetical protein